MLDLLTSTASSSGFCELGMSFVVLAPNLHFLSLSLYLSDQALNATPCMPSCVTSIKLILPILDSVLHKFKFADDNIVQVAGPCLASGAVCEELVGLASMRGSSYLLSLYQVVLLAINSALKALQPCSMLTVPEFTSTFMIESCVLYLGLP